MDEQSIFLEALEKPGPDAQAAWLDGACGEDEALKQRLMKMLQKHQHAKSFLEQPPTGLEGTIVHDVSRDNLAAALDAGLAPVFGNDAAVVLGDANHSVLRSIGNTLDEVPRVSLRESKAERDDPVSRPSSPEIPNHQGDGRYQLQGEIARGGMGAIIKGRDTDLGRDLAIKVLLDSQKDKPDVVRRFVEEAQIGGQLQHPGIAPVYELGQFADQRPFFSMKLVKGETLAKLLADREIPETDRGRFIGIFEQVCQTMAYAHSRGVIHRDLKPANIMVGAFGEVQVMDWGLAKVLSDGGVADEKKSRDRQQGQSIIQTLRSGLGSDSPDSVGSIGSQTQMGSVMGTPAYMPPEQALGEIDNLDERADVFGLGAILCEILTGKPAYVGDDGTAIYRLASRGKLDEAFERLDACGADADLIALTKHCLELEPQDRPRDAGALAQRVSGYLETVEAKLRASEIDRAAQAARAEAEALRADAESARVEEERKRRRVQLALVASVLVMLALGGAGWMYLEKRSADKQRELAAQKQEERNDAEATRLVEGLLQADTSQVKTIIGTLAAYRQYAKDDLSKAFADSPDDSNAKLHAALAMLPEDNSVLSFLKERLLTVTPMQFEHVRSLLAEHSNDLTADYWQIALDSSQDPAQRFQTACALAGYDTENERWQDEKFVEFVTGRLVGVLPSELLPWRNALRPVKEHLTAPLAAIYRDDEKDVQVRGFATDTLADYLSDDAEGLFDLLADANEKQFGPVFGKLTNHKERAVVLGNAELSKSPSVTMDWTVRFYKIDDGELNPRTNWEGILKSPVLDELRTAQLDLREAVESPPPPTDKVPSQFFATVATTVVTLEDDEYDFTITFDDGVRVSLDDKQVFENWAANAPKTKTVTIQGQPGQHTLKVEHFQLQVGYVLAAGIQLPKEAFAMRQANAAVMLLRMDAAENVWSLLKHSPDPGVRSYIIHWLSPRGGDPQTIIARYEQETDVTIKRALLLCLGEFDASRLPRGEREPLIETLLAVYRSDPDAGLHAAAEWLLRKWGQAERLAPIDKELQQNEKQLAAEKENKRQWYINSQGQTFVILDAGEFQMGSPPSEAGRGAAEGLHRRQIGRRYAISAKEVTRAQWRVFAKSQPGNFWPADQEQLKATIRTDDSPMLAMTWYEAARYCNWLSEREGIPKEQWCYEPNDKGQYGPGMKAKQDFWKLTGYRLPTEAEWEFACRAEASTSRYYGLTENLLPKYAWSQANGDSRSWPVASLKPNDFGLFDMQGNAFEWVYDAFSGYPMSLSAAAKDTPKTATVSEADSRMLRGGSFVYRASLVRSACRASHRPSNRDLYLGFRPARTYHLFP